MTQQDLRFSSHPLKTGSKLPDISKINALAIGSVSKVDGLAKASILDIDGVAVPSAFTGLLDESYASGAVRAYSTRRLYSLYTGACLRVRESGGNTETDIGFDSNGDLDTAAIASHCGSNDGFIRYWYDQSQSGATGSGVDAENSTAADQPKIYDGTNGILENASGVPFLTFRDSWGSGSPHLDMGGLIPSGVSPRSLFSAFGAGGDTVNAQTQMTCIGPETGILEYLTRVQAGRIKFHNTVVIPGGQSDPFDDRIIACSSDGVTGLNHSNTITSTTVPSSFLTATEIIFGRGAQNNRQMERAYELILYTTAKSTSDHNSIRGNMNAYYAFYT